MISNKQTYIYSLEGKDIINASEKGYTIKKGKKRKGTLDYSLECIQLDSLNKDYFYQIDNKQYTNAIINLNFSYSVKDENGKTTMNISEIRDELYKNGFMCNIDGVAKKYVKYKRSSGSSRKGKCLFILEEIYSTIIEWSMMGLQFSDEENIDLPALEAYLALTTSSIIDTLCINPQSILVVNDEVSVFQNKVMETKLIDGSLHTDINNSAEITNKIWDGMSLLDCSVFGRCDNDNIQWVDGKYANKGMLLLRNRFFKSCCFNTNIQKFFKDNNITDIKQLNGITLADDIEQIKIITTPSSIKLCKFYKQWGSREECIRYYLNGISETFGIVKYEKPTKHFNGKYVSTSYQLLNTVNFKNEKTLKKFLYPTIDYINKVKNDMRVFRNHLKIKIEQDTEIGEITTADELMLTMLQINNQYLNSDIFLKFKDDVIERLKNKASCGRILVEGNYSTLLSCPIEMLQYSINKWDKKTSVLGKGNVMCKRFKRNVKLIGVRSPHCTMGNLLYCTNKFNSDIDNYINLTNEIVVINTIGENILNRLSSADMDSDTMLLTNNKYILSSVKKYYNEFLVPTTGIEGTWANYKYTEEDMSKLDSATSKSQQMIGEIVNLSAFLNSILWDRLNTGDNINDLQELYKAICQLDVMSTFAIDSAKKTFEGLDLSKELIKIRAKWLDKDIVNKKLQPAPLEIREIFLEKIELRDAIKILEENKEDNKEILQKLRKELKEKNEKLKNTDYRFKAIRPTFFKYLPNPNKTNIKYIYKDYNCTMDKIGYIINSSIERKERNSNKYTLELLQLFDLDVVTEDKADYRQIKNIINDVTQMVNECNAIFSREDINFKQKCAEQTIKRKEVIDRWQGKITDKTIKKILQDLAHKDTYNKCERKLVNVLFKSNKEAFLSLFKQNIEEIEILERVKKNSIVDDSTEIIKLYGVEYKVAIKQIKLQKYSPVTLDISKFILPPMEKKCN